jgi:transposase-like protein
VLGFVEREGELRTFHIPNVKAVTIQGALTQNVEKGATVMTDEDGAFVGIAPAYAHHTVNHSKGEYVRGDVHSNTMESVWALLKRQIFGIHHWVSSKHLDKYIDEMTWRFNRRDLTVEPRMNDLFACVEGRLPYKVLIS